MKNIFNSDFKIIHDDFDLLNSSKNEYTEIVKSTRSLKFLKLTIPPSLFTQDSKKIENLRSRYKSLLSKELYQKISINAFLNIKREIDVNGNLVDIHKLIQISLIKYGVEEILKVKLTSELEEKLKTSMGMYLSSITDSKKLLLLSVLPIPHFVKLFFLKKKKSFLVEADKVLNLIYDLHYQNNNNVIVDLKNTNVSKEEIKVYLSTILLNLVTLSNSISILLFLLSQSSKNITQFVEDKNYAILCYIESLRIFPTIGFISMDVRKKSTCPFSLLKKKITISVDLFKAQTNKKYWNNPFDFTIEKQSVKY